MGFGILSIVDDCSYGIGLDLIAKQTQKHINRRRHHALHVEGPSRQRHFRDSQNERLDISSVVHDYYLLKSNIYQTADLLFKGFDFVRGIYYRFL